MCLARKSVKIVVTLVTFAGKALFYKGLNGNQQIRKNGYGNLKKWLLRGMIMTNDTIKALFNDTHNGFFRKWRDRVPAPDSDDWERIVREAGQLMEKYGHDQRAKQIILWFLDELDTRSKRRQEKGGC